MYRYLQKIIVKLFTKFVFCWHLGLEVNDRNSRIRIIKSEAWIHGSGSTPKCQGSAPLVLTDLDPAVPGGGAPRVDAHAEDALVRGIQRVAGLAAQPALDDDAQLLTRLLVQVHLSKPSRQRVVLHLISS